jgi:hypothetical protein
MYNIYNTIVLWKYAKKEGSAPCRCAEARAAGPRGAGEVSRRRESRDIWIRRIVFPTRETVDAKVHHQICGTVIHQQFLGSFEIVFPFLGREKGTTPPARGDVVMGGGHWVSPFVTQMLSSPKSTRKPRVFTIHLSVRENGRLTYTTIGWVAT